MLLLVMGLQKCLSRVLKIYFYFLCFFHLLLLLFIYLFIYLFNYLFIHVIYLSIYLFIYLFIYLVIYLFKMIYCHKPDCVLRRLSGRRALFLPWASLKLAPLISSICRCKKVWGFLPVWRVQFTEL